MWSTFQGYYKQLKYLSFFLTRGWCPLMVHCWLDDSLASPPADNKLPFSQPESANEMLRLTFMSCVNLLEHVQQAWYLDLQWGWWGGQRAGLVSAGWEDAAAAPEEAAAGWRFAGLSTVRPEAAMRVKSHRLKLVHTACALYVLVSPSITTVNTLMSSEQPRMRIILFI